MIGVRRLAEVKRPCCDCARMETEDSEEVEKRAMQVELHRQEEALQKARRRKRCILVVGTLFQLPTPFVIFPGVAAFFVSPFYASLLLVPVATGALIAFLGITFASMDHKRAVKEWGQEQPARCLLYAHLCLLPTLVFDLSFLVILTVMWVPGWFLSVAGGWAAAALLTRISRPDP